jgi:hypothetical protein
MTDLKSCQEQSLHKALIAWTAAERGHPVTGTLVLGFSTGGAITHGAASCRPSVRSIKLLVLRSTTHLPMAGLLRPRAALHANPVHTGCA